MTAFFSSEFWAANRALLGIRMTEHLQLMAWSVLAACVVALPAGILASSRRWLAGPILALAGIVQTIPSVALLGFLLPLLGIGTGTAAVALFFYALLPIVRNTITGLNGVDPGVVDAARGMGMTPRQLLFQVQLPLARPTIFAGIRTAAVINVGVTTLSALVGAGGLGTFIFRGLATNNPAVILLGAVPAALLALTVEAGLGFCERVIQARRGLWLAAALPVAVVGVVLAMRVSQPPLPSTPLKFGFTSEFMQRPDGYAAWRARYGLPALDAVELDPGLLYEALRRGDVDLACGFSTDGRITAFDLKELADDRQFFPRYEAALVARRRLFQTHPALRPLLLKLEGAVNEKQMQALNLRVDRDQLTATQAAAEFLAEWAPRAGVAWNADAARRKAGSSGPADLTIGTKNFTEQYVLGQIVQQLVNGATPLHAGLKAGLGGTAVCWQALRHGDIDLYPEYSGTLVTSILKPPPAVRDHLAHSAARSRSYLETTLRQEDDLEWIAPFGFNNTYTLLTRREDSRFESLHTLSELGRQIVAAHARDDPAR